MREEGPKSILTDPIIRTMQKTPIPDGGVLETGGVYVFDSDQKKYILFTWKSIPQKFVILINPALRRCDGITLTKIPTENDKLVYGLMIDPEYNLVFGFSNEGKQTPRGSHTCERM